MAEVLHERLKSPIPTNELERRSKEMRAAMKKAGLDCLLTQNLTQYLGGANRWLTDTIAENQYPQSAYISKDGDIGYLACAGAPADLYPPPHLLRIGQSSRMAPYFSVFNYTWDWEGKLFGKWLETTSCKRLGVAGLQTIQWNLLDYIRRHYPGIEIVDASDLFDELRAVKSKAELAFVDASASVLDKVMGYLPLVAQAGTHEYEVRAKAMQIVTDLGGEEMVIRIGSGTSGRAFSLYPSLYQNRRLDKGDELYVGLSCSGPGGMFTTLGRMFSIGQAASADLLARVEKAADAQAWLVKRLTPGADPADLFKKYNAYLAKQGMRKEAGMFAYGQGYDFVERPSLQPGETMPLQAGMSLALHTALTNDDSSVYLADSYIVTSDGSRKLSALLAGCMRT